MSKDPNLATLYELEVKYNTLALYCFIEALEFKQEMEEISMEETKLEKDRLRQEQPKGKRGR